MMFGVDSMEDYVKSVESSLAFRHSGPVMVVISELSDVQEHIEHGDLEEARKALNRVKFLTDHWFSEKGD